MSDNRAFHYAIVVSLVLHALALFALPDLVYTARRAASIPPQLIARLMEPEPELEKPAPAPAPPVAQPEKPPTTKPAVTKRPVERLPQVETPVVREAAPQPAPPTVQEEAVEPPPVAAVEPRPAPPAPAAPAQAPEAVSRDQYRVQLIDEARRHKRYPPLARENNWQGSVRVAVAVGANGRASVTLKSSSGYDVLDRQAVEMFSRAARAVPVPPALRGREFSLELGAVYGLED